MVFDRIWYVVVIRNEECSGLQKVGSIDRPKIECHLHITHSYYSSIKTLCDDLELPTDLQSNHVTICLLSHSGKGELHRILINISSKALHARTSSVIASRAKYSPQSRVAPTHSASILDPQD